MIDSRPFRCSIASSCGFSRRLLLSGLLPILAPFNAFADDSPDKVPSLFSQLFPEPTGKNGYEEIIRASERLRENKAPYPGPSNNTLSVKRAYLADPASRVALSLVRLGMQKPVGIVSSETSPLYMTFAPLRALARLFGFRVYVGFADGDGAAVVSDVLTFLRFVDVYKALGVVAGSTGGALEQVVLTPTIQLQDSWSERDSARMFDFARRRADAPDPSQAALVAERSIAQTLGKSLQTDSERLNAQFEYLAQSEDNKGVTTAAVYAERLRADAGVQARVWSELPDAINSYYDRAAKLLADPAKKITLETPAIEASRFHEITLYLRRSLVLDVDPLVRQSINNRLSNRILGVHAAIRRYRWEHDRLPKTLDELRLPDNLVTDQFTGKPLVYEPEPTGTRYKLGSSTPATPSRPQE
jgi:hypothetical protein